MISAVQLDCSICVLDFAFLPSYSNIFFCPGAARFISLQYNPWDQLSGNTMLQTWSTSTYSHMPSGKTGEVTRAQMCQLKATQSCRCRAPSATVFAMCLNVPFNKQSLG